MPRLHYPTRWGFTGMDVNMPVAVGDHLICGGLTYEVVDERNGEFYLQSIQTAMPSNHIDPAFQRRQEAQRQQDLQRSAEAQAARVRRQAGNPAITTAQALDWDRDFEQQMIYGQSITHVSSAGQVRSVDPELDRRAILPLYRWHEHPANPRVPASAPVSREGIQQAPYTAHRHSDGAFTLADLDTLIASMGTNIGQRTSTVVDWQAAFRSISEEGASAGVPQPGYQPPSKRRELEVLKQVAAQELVATQARQQEQDAADEWLKSSPWG